MGQMVATSEISTELTEIFFLVKHAKQDSTAENCFAPHNEPPTAIVSFSGVVKHFFQKLTKKPFSFQSNRGYLWKKQGIIRDGLFPP